MTPLQQAAQAVIARWDKTRYVMQDEMSALRDALADEQTQAVEPHGWMIDGMSEVMSRGHAQAVQTEHQATGGIAVAYPVYLHPALPAQPVAAPMTTPEIEKCWYQVKGTSFGYAPFARAIEQHHGITKPDHKTDWSAA